MESLDKAYALFKRNKTGAVMVSQDRKIFHLPYHEIIYMEISGHYFFIHTKTQGEFKVKKRMDDMLSMLDERLFVRCHRSFIVNVAFITCLSRRDVTLKNEKTLPLSEANIQPVTRTFTDYYNIY